MSKVYEESLIETSTRCCDSSRGAPRLSRDRVEIKPRYRDIDVVLRFLERCAEIKPRSSRDQAEIVPRSRRDRAESERSAAATASEVPRTTQVQNGTTAGAAGRAGPAGWPRG